MLRKLSFQRIILHIIAMSFIWWMLADGDHLSWFVGVPAIFLSLFVSAQMPPLQKWHIRITQIIPFFFYFLKQSLVSGGDVIKRAFHPQCPIDPGFLTYSTQIQNPIAFVFFANAISLLPGTFSASIKERQIEVHVLDVKLPNVENLQDLESKIAILFDEEIRHG